MGPYRVPLWKLREPFPGIPSLLWALRPSFPRSIGVLEGFLHKGAPLVCPCYDPWVRSLNPLKACFRRPLNPLSFSRRIPPGFLKFLKSFVSFSCGKQDSILHTLGLCRVLDPVYLVCWVLLVLSFPFSSLWEVLFPQKGKSYFYPYPEVSRVGFFFKKVCPLSKLPVEFLGYLPRFLYTGFIRSPGPLLTPGSILGLKARTWRRLGQNSCLFSTIWFQ